MSRVSDAAERVEKFLREHAARTASPDVVLVEYAENEVLDVRTDDLSLLVECAQWLLMASSAELRAEYATASGKTDLSDEKLRAMPLELAEQHVEKWNASKARADKRRARGLDAIDIEEGFVIKRLVSAWERRA